MTPETFTRKVGDVEYSVEAEVLPSGAGLFTFTPPLPGRSASVYVDEDLFADLIRTTGCGCEWDPESDQMVLSLHLVQKTFPTPEEKDFQTALEVVPAKVILECAVEQLIKTCNHCGQYEFGDDISEAAVAQLKKKPVTYLN